MSDMKKLNILITSIGRGTDMVVIFQNALGENGKVFVSNSVMTSALLKADGYTITPLIVDETYVDFLLDYCKANDINAIISWFDLDLAVLSKNKERFEKNGITVLVSDEQVIKTCNDKWNTHRFLASAGLKQPKTYIDPGLLKQDLRANVIPFPVMMKPRWGSGSVGLFQIDDFDELDVLYRKTHKIIFRSVVQYESAVDANRCIIMQEKLDGIEYGLDILNDLNGNYVATVAKKKLLIHGSTQVAQIVDSKPFEDTAKTVSKNLKHIGNLDLDCFLTEQGDIYVIDLNCRFGGQYVFDHMAGANFPKQIIDWLLGLPVSPENINVETGARGCKEDSPAVRF
ncbi:MAG: ATP-grasp domain-containing protein [Bacteroidales bacterium]|jgi:carbamoyl-phosphate synthase large subunit|nr:ATP-grasp domain-containing protein [Bacteroidales bacterium]